MQDGSRLRGIRDPEFGELVTRKLTEHSWSASDLSRRAGVSETSISKARHGRPIDASTRRAIEGAFHDARPHGPSLERFANSS